MLIARTGINKPEALTDPDGNRVTLVPEGYLGITRIGVRLGVRDLAAHRDFYGRVLELEEIPVESGIAFRCGDSMILAEEDPDAPADAAMDGPGWRYITVQIFKVDEEHAAILARGGAEGAAPRTLGETARISFIRDPDGNWIEMSQRASLTGSLD